MPDLQGNWKGKAQMHAEAKEARDQSSRAETIRPETMSEPALFSAPVTVRTLRVGDTWAEWDVWNTGEGLRRIPKSKVGIAIDYVQPRDIFLRPLSMPQWVTLADFERWNRRRDHE